MKTGVALRRWRVGANGRGAFMDKKFKIQFSEERTRGFREEKKISWLIHRRVYLINIHSYSPPGKRCRLSYLRARVVRARGVAIFESKFRIQYTWDLVCVYTRTYVHIYLYVCACVQNTTHIHTHTSKIAIALDEECPGGVDNARRARRQKIVCTQSFSLIMEI